MILGCIYYFYIYDTTTYLHQRFFSVYWHFIKKYDLDDLLQNDIYHC